MENTDNSAWLEEVQELQAIELDLFRELVRICSLHNIRFFMAEGSLLGAVRHKGFIPWDDDIDVAMLREDYERFLQVAPKELGAQYTLQHQSVMDNYWLPFAKIRLITDSTKFRQTHIAHLTENNGPFLDIFPLDSVPKKSSAKQKFTQARIKFVRGMITRKLKCKPHSDLSGAVAYFCSRFFTVQQLHNKLHRLHTAMNRADNEWIVNWESSYGIGRETFPKTAFEQTVMVPFEQYEAPVPCGYDTVLSTIYGDYMTLPPVEQQVCKHRFDESSD